MSRPDHRTRRASVLPLLLLALLAGAASGCVGMPRQGPIVEMDPPIREDASTGTFYDPAPPERGASAQEIVLGFLEAMKATPIRTSVAAEYLSVDAQGRWQPEHGMITYSDLGEPAGESQVSLSVADAQTYDSRGAWSGPLAGDPAVLTFPMTMEDQQWRIDAAPDALVVPDSWFEDRFERASLHFLDPTGAILVPEPVFVPTGDQFATALVRGLLAGPAPSSAGAVRSFIPPGLRLALSSVPISRAGVAEVSLEGAASTDADGIVGPEMVAQLAWTLRQEPRVRAVRLLLGGRPLPLPDGAQEISWDDGARFDPNGLAASTSLFAVRDGLLVAGELDDLEPTGGAFGTKRYGLRTVGVNLPGTRVAGVSDRGTSVLLASVTDPDAPVVQVLSGATDLIAPAWDFSDRVWLVDRTAQGAQVYVVVENQARALPVPGLTGTRVERFLVSRDGSRLVALVRGPRKDRVTVSRVLHDDGGRVLRVSRAREIDLGLALGERITDIGWRSPVSVALLSEADELSQVRTVAVDGAPGDLDTGGASRIRGGASALVSSPVPGESVLVIGSTEVTDLVDPVRRIPALDEQVTWLGYVG